MIVKLAIVAIIGYLLGSLNLSVIVSKFYGIDVRTMGSKNAGFTNTLRILGKKAALITLLGDFLKGILACLIGGFIAGNLNELNENGLLIAGFMSIIGHNWPIYFGFKGGKGVLTSIAVIFMMDVKFALILLIVFVIIVAIFRYVSLGSIISAFLFPIISLLGLVEKKSWNFIIVAFLFAILVIIRHYQNIKRLMNGTESKLGLKNS